MTDSRLVLRIFIRAFIVLVLSAPLIVLLLAFQTKAVITPGPTLTADEISQVENLIVNSAPDDMQSVSLQTLSLSAAELNLLIRYALELLDLSQVMGGQVILADQAIEAQWSAPLWRPGFPLWLNFDAHFSSQSTRLNLDAMQLGLMNIPANLVNELLGQIRQTYLVNNPAYVDLQKLASSVQSINVRDGRLQIDLLWEPALIARISDQARYFLISSDDQLRIKQHYQLLHEVLESVPESTRAISLNSLLVPLFSAAEQKSGADPVAENRTLFLTLAMYVNEEDVERLLGASLAADLPRARQIEVRVHRRQDLAQHIVSSAAITAYTSSGFAEILSSTKEAYDARYRSGYSFSDLAANTVGVALGKAATDSRDSARTMQQRLARLTDESEYLPPLGDNQDGILEADFNVLYANNSAEYQQRLKEIEALVYSRPLFAGL